MKITRAEPAWLQNEDGRTLLNLTGYRLEDGTLKFVPAKLPEQITGADWVEPEGVKVRTVPASPETANIMA